MAIAQTRNAVRQDLTRARGGTITGRGGNVQQLGAAAQRRLQGGVTQAAQPPKLPWQQLRDAGVAGQGSSAANRTAAAALPGQPSVGGGRLPMTFPGEPMKDPASVLANIDRAPGIAPGVRDGIGQMGDPGQPYGADGVMNELPGLFPGGGGGMASYLRPGAIGQMVRGVGQAAQAAPPGVDSNPFAQVGTAQDGEPLQAAQNRAGQAGRIAQLIQRLRGAQPQMMGA